LTYARDQMRSEFEEASRRRQQQEDRARRHARRLGTYDAEAHEELSFKYGFRDTCPRCGLDLSQEGDDEAQFRHLRNCSDKNAHLLHREREGRTAAAKATAEKKAVAQHQAAGVAVFNFCGGGATQLWLLNADQLKKLCNKEDLPAKGTRDELIERLADLYAKRKGQTAALTDLPKNLHTMSDTQLSGVCAAHRLKGLSSRDDRIEALEELATGVPTVHDAPKAIAGQSKAIAIMDKKYLLKQGKRVVNGQAMPSAVGKAKAKGGLTPPRKRRRVADDSFIDDS